MFVALHQGGDLCLVVAHNLAEASLQVPPGLGTLAFTGKWLSSSRLVWALGRLLS